MTVSLAQARELQHIVRTNPSAAPAIVGDLVAALNSRGTSTGRVSSLLVDPLAFQAPRPAAPVQAPTLTPEQQEQRLLDDLDAVRKQKEEAEAKAKAEEAKKARLDAIDRAVALSQATSDVLQAIRGQVNYNSGDVVSRDTWWKFRKELAPVVVAHGFKLVNVGTKSKPKAALAEV